MKQINPEHTALMMDLINHSPFFMLLSMKACQLDMGYSRIELVVERKHHNPFGAIHGGVYSSMIDTAAYWAAYCEMEEDTGYTSIDIKVDNLSMMKEGRMIAEGRTLKIGRSICLSEATVKDTKGKLLAHGTSKLMVVTGLQSVRHAIEAMEYRALPPKYIE